MWIMIVDDSVFDEYILVTFGIDWLMNCVIIEYVTWWICALVKFVECCDYVDWCICTLVDFADDCEYLN